MLCIGCHDAHAAQTAAGNAQANEIRRVEVSGVTEIEAATGVSREQSHKLEWLVQPTLKITLGSRLDLTAVTRLRADMFDELEPGDPSQSEVSRFSRRLIVGDRFELELRELYAAVTLGRSLVTLGKQQIVWGKADGLKVLDVVNPQDFREFILDEFDQSRIPLWSATVEVPIKSGQVQLVWVPDRTYHKLAEPHATFAFVTPALAPTVPPDSTSIAVRPVARPRRFLADSDGGMRISTFWKGWDLAANYLFHYDDFPVPVQERSVSSSGVERIFSPHYSRTHLVGATFSNAFGSLTVRGEMGAFFDRRFVTRDPHDADGVVAKNELAYVMGFDWYGLRESLLSIQILQSLVGQAEGGLMREPIETDVTVFLQREFLNDTLAAEVMWLHGLQHDDGLLRPKIRYQLRDNVALWIGADLFFGTRQGIFGQFALRDRAVAGMAWWFGSSAPTTRSAP